MIGQTISHYRILEKLGSGGMGVVYKAEDTNLDRTVALKVLAPHLLESKEHRERFLREAKAAAALDHPNICMVHEVGDADGQVFLAMGYVDGPEVRAKVKERPLKLGEALDIAIQAAEGLRAAHQKGIVHRDIKSSNLMLTSAGQVKIMDFGLAQLTGGSRLTKTDTILGTPAYMSPEQAQCLATDRRTDIWSLGVVLFEMVTGRLPFEAEREQAVLYSIINEPHEPVTAIRAGVPLELDRIVGKALAKKQEERYQHLDDMLVDLRALRKNLGSARATGAWAAARQSVRRSWMWAALAAAVLVAGYFAWQAVRAPDAAEPLRAVALTTFPGAELYPSFSPDGSHVAFTWTGSKQDNADIYIQQIGSGSPLRLTSDPHSDYNPVWSPDGRWIAFLRRQSQAGKDELRLIPPLGGLDRKLIEIRVSEGYFDAAYLAWGPDSNFLVVTDSQGEGRPEALFVVSLETGEKRQLTNPQAPVISDTNPALSPDGRSLLFRRNLGRGAFRAGVGELYWLALGKGLTADGEPRRLTTATMEANYPAWMPDGREVLFSAAGSLWRLATPSENLRPARLPFVGEDGLMPVVSRPPSGRSGRLVYVRSFSDWNIWRVETRAPGEPSSSPPAVSISSTRNEFNAQFSPDGRRVAFQSNRSGEYEIWSADPDGANDVQLTSMGAPMTAFPRWSPDCQLIAFSSNSEGQFEIYVVPEVGGKPRRLTSHPAGDHIPSFSRDGQWIYFMSDRSGEHQIWRTPVSGGEAVQITHNVGFAAFESPDGAYLYYTQTAVAPGALWRLPTSGGQPVKVLDGVVLRAFAVLEKGIYYIERPSDEARLQFFDFASGKSRTVARNLGDVRQGLTASPDGRTILYSRQDSSGDDLMLVENFR
jgi:Tol biopolymer transport system component